MARIKEYNLQTNAAGPERKPEATQADTGNIGAAIANLGGQIGDAATLLDRRQGQAEVADISAKLSKVHADYTTKLQETLQKATPEDLDAGTPRGAPGSVSITNRFMGEFDKSLEDIGGQTSTRAGREYFQKSSQGIRQHLSVSMAQGQASLAGAKAVADTKDNIQNSSTALMNDPTAFEVSKNNFNEYVKQMVATQGLPVEKAFELQRMGESNLAEGAARGWININPQFAKKKIEEGSFDSYISGDQKKQLLGEADMHITAAHTEQKRLEKDQKDAFKEREDAAQDQMLNKIYNNQLSTKDILNSPDLKYAAKKEMLSALTKHTTESIKTNPETFRNLWDDIHAPDGDPHKITDVNQLNRYVGAGITVADLQKLRGEMNSKKTPEGQLESQLKKGFTDMAKNQLTKSNQLTGLRDPLGDEQYQAFLADFSTQFNKQKAAGKSGTQLLNPSSPDYMGNMIKTYVKTPQQLQQEMADQLRKSIAPPNEQMIDVISPSGQPGKIPASKLDEASKRGFKRK
jgi:hypothetical protein